MLHVYRRVVCAAIMAMFVFASPSAVLARSNNFGVTAAPRLSGGQVVHNLTFNSPFDVKQIRATATGSYLTVELLDCCVVGDQWTHRTYCTHNDNAWDVRGRTRSDSVTVYSGRSEVWRNGSLPIDCIVEIRYSGGTSEFPAGMSVRLTSGGGGTVTTTVLTTPTALPSQ